MSRPGGGTSIQRTCWHAFLRIWETGTPPVIHIADRPGDVRRHMADVSKLVSHVGSHPAVLDADALSETVEWYQRSFA